MIASVHLADVGWRRALGALRGRPDPGRVPGLLYCEVALAAPLSAGLLPALQPGRVGLIAAWENDAAFDLFWASHPLAHRLAGGWHVRLEPLRTSGSWSELPDLPGQERPVDPSEPVAVLTLGRPRLSRIGSFLPTSAAAEGQALGEPALLASTALARFPRLVATFSLWRTAEAMRSYAYGQAGQAHLQAIHAQRARPFHHESAFIRFRPYAAQGMWDGRDPLANTCARED